MERTDHDEGDGAVDDRRISTARPSVAAAEPPQSGKEHQTTPKNPEISHREAKVLVKMIEQFATPGSFRYPTAECVDFKKLSKRAPETAQYLRDGTVDPENLIEQMVSKFGNTCVDSESGHVSRCDMIDVLAIILVCNAFPDARNSCVARNEKYEGFTDDLEATIRQTFRESFDLNDDPLPCVARIAKSAFHHTCQAWMSRLGGRTFRRHCKLFNAPVQEFQRIVENEHPAMMKMMGHDQAEEQMRQNLKTAFNGIIGGLDQTKKKCWQCDCQSETLKICSQCGYARYCNRECQVQHWKTAHKHGCATLPAKYAFYEDGLVAIDEAHETGELEGLQLSYEYDHEIARLIALLDYPLPEEEEEEES